MSSRTRLDGSRMRRHLHLRRGVVDDGIRAVPAESRRTLDRPRQACGNATPSTAQNSELMTALASAPARSSAALAPWGMMAVVDLHDADRERLADPDNIRAFV